MTSAEALVGRELDEKLLTISPRLRLLCGSRESVVLVAEDETHGIREPLEAALIEAVHRLGTVRDARIQLSETCPHEDLDLAIASLRTRHILAPCKSGARATAAYWDSLGSEPVRATVAFMPLCDAAAELIPHALGANGISISCSAELLVVTTDDYLRPEIAALAQREQPWLLAKPVGHTIWVGPLFVPGRSVCWNCLAGVMRSHRWAQAPFSGWNSASFPPQPSVAALPTTIGLAAGLITTAVSVWCATGNHPVLHNHVLTLDTRTLQQSSNRVRPLPSCLTCSRHAYHPDEGLHWLVSPISGIVSRVQVTDQRYGGFFQAQAIFSSPVPVGPSRHILRPQHSAGKGRTSHEAESTAIAEAVERYSLIYRGNESTITGDSHMADALNVPQILLFSEHQYATREIWNETHSELQWVPERFDPDAQIEWTTVTSLSDPNVTKYVPSALCYMDYPSRLPFCMADTNGCAAGRSLEQALLSALLELIERDAVAIWWYNQLERPALSLPDIGDREMFDLKQGFAAIGRDLYVLDLTTDLGVPACVAVAPRFDGSQPCFASAAARSMRTAAFKAISEVSQICFWTSVDAGSEELLTWLRTHNVENHSYLRAHGLCGLTEREPLHCSEALQRCVASLEIAGIQAYFADLTRREIGIPVVRCIAPGLRHFWRRLAPGRLYDVPAQLGWLPAPRAEQDMNPISCMI